jgi:cytochrome c oxidase subunit 2
MTGLLVPEASRFAGRWDQIFFVLLALSIAIAGLVFVLIVGFSIRYRKDSAAPRPRLPEATQIRTEFIWTAATALAFILIFWWAAAAQLRSIVPPHDPFEIHVLAKQWMWTVQQPNGVREINELHAPIGRPVELIMTSEDVIHALFLPALRLKEDVLPGRYTYLWFTADRPGIYRLMCTEYCGTSHSRMTGQLVLMTPEDYSRWSAAQPQADDLALRGKALFSSLGCAGCHVDSTAVHAPDLRGIFGRPVQLADGRTLVADEAYVRDKILFPSRSIPAGYEPDMPSFRGIVSEEQILALFAYVRSLATGGKHP